MTRFTGEYAADRKQIHNRVRAEAGNRCVRCLHPEGDTPSLRVPCDDRCTHVRDGKMRILTVHHLTGQKDDNRWWNLLALCQSCHLTIQGRVIPERPWIFYHSLWFIPYACGFYASYYGGVDITRAQAEADPVYWLALGQPWLYPDVPSIDIERWASRANPYLPPENGLLESFIGRDLPLPGHTGAGL